MDVGLSAENRGEGFFLGNGEFRVVVDLLEEAGALINPAEDGFLSALEHFLVFPNLKVVEDVEEARVLPNGGEEVASLVGVVVFDVDIGELVRRDRVDGFSSDLGVDLGELVLVLHYIFNYERQRSRFYLGSAPGSGGHPLSQEDSPHTEVSQLSLLQRHLSQIHPP